MRVIFLFGIISLLGDVIYEGIRSIIGVILADLGATAIIVGLFTGIAEFLNYSLRIFSGYISDKKQSYWILTITGYLLIIPLVFLGYTKYWQVAILLIILERIGKAIRTPARDTLISFASKNIGIGTAFGIHEFFDQLGAVLGPFIFYLAALKTKNYLIGFNIMWIFIFLLILSLILIKKIYIFPPDIYEKTEKEEIPNLFYFYIIFVFLTTLGLLNYPLISFYLRKQNIVNISSIPLLYLLCMGVDGITALFIGKIYDKIKFKSLILTPILTFLVPILVFKKSIILIVFGIIVLGIIIGIQETIMRAGIADIVGIKKRGYGYGIFNSIYGFSVFLSGGIFGYLYQKFPNLIILYTFVVEILSSFIFLLFIKNYNSTTLKKNLKE